MFNLIWYMFEMFEQNVTGNVSNENMWPIPNGVSFEMFEQNITMSQPEMDTMIHAAAFCFIAVMIPSHLLYSETCL